MFLQCIRPTSFKMSPLIRCMIQLWHHVSCMLGSYDARSFSLFFFSLVPRLRLFSFDVAARSEEESAQLPHLCAWRDRVPPPAEDDWKHTAIHTITYNITYQQTSSFHILHRTCYVVLLAPTSVPSRPIVVSLNSLLPQRMYPKQRIVRSHLQHVIERKGSV